MVSCFSDTYIFQLAYNILDKEELHYIPEEYMLQMFLYPYRTSIFAYTIVLKTTSISSMSNNNMIKPGISLAMILVK